MGLFDIFKFSTKETEQEMSIRLDKDRELLSLRNYQKNKKHQLNMLPTTITQLREIGVTENDSLKLEYFFYAYSKEKAEHLNQTLKEEFGYEVAPLQPVKNVIVISGWSKKILIQNNVISNWVIDMCDVALKCNCDFDGWGTTPEQE
jgi:regulator of RNase E activity RraB